SGRDPREGEVIPNSFVEITPKRLRPDVELVDLFQVGNAGKGDRPVRVRPRAVADLTGNAPPERIFKDDILVHKEVHAVLRKQAVALSHGSVNVRGLNRYVEGRNRTAGVPRRQRGNGLRDLVRSGLEGLPCDGEFNGHVVTS